MTLASQSIPSVPNARFTDEMRNPQTEAQLESHGVDFTEAVLPLDAIDEQASLRNQARLTPFKMNIVDNYAAAMERDEQFPAIVVRRAGKRFIVVDGNHRLQATKKVGGDQVAAYVVGDIPDELVRFLIVALNKKHGAQLTDDERLIHAMHLIDMGAKATDAAEAVGLPTHRVRRERNKLIADRRAFDLGVQREWSKLNASTQGKIASVRNDNVFKAITKFAVDARLSSTQVSELVIEINKLRSEEAQLASISNARDLMKQQIQMTAGGVLRPKQSRARPLLMAACANIVKLDINEIASSTVPENKAELASQCLETAEILREYAKQLSV